MDLGLNGLRVIITGGSGRIGLHSARMLLADGAGVALVARDEGRLSRAADLIRSEVPDGSERVLSVVADTAADASVDKMVQQVTARWGGVDALVNAAAMPSPAFAADPLAAVNDEVIPRDVEMKAIGYLRVIRAVAPHMIRLGAGRIVNVGGINLRRTGATSGSVRNAAVAAITANVAASLGPHGIGVVAVHPGELGPSDASATERGPTIANSLGRWVTVEEVARVIAFLTSPAAAGVTGGSVTVDGGSPDVVFY